METSSKPLKILHLTTHINIGGITSYLLEVGSAMVKKGHQVSVLSAGGECEPLFQGKGMGTFSFPIRTKSEFHPKLFFCLPKIIRLVREEKFDLLHAHTRVTQVMAFFISQATKVPFLTTAHGYYKPRLGRRLFGCWGRKTIAISPLVGEELKKSHELKADRIRVVCNAIDIEGFCQRIAQKNPEKVREELGIDPGAFVLGSVSRLVRDKGHEYLVEAAATLHKKNKNLYLLIVGKGRERERLQKLIEKKGISNSAKILDSRQDITSILSMIDVFVHPATFREGFGLGMLEAMAAKIPVVTTDIWAINSIIRNHINGFLVKPKSASEIVKAIDFIQENKTQTESIVRNAYEMACELFSMDRMAREMEMVYRELV